VGDEGRERKSPTLTTLLRGGPSPVVGMSAPGTPEGRFVSTPQRRVREGEWSPRGFNGFFAVDACASRLVRPWPTSTRLELLDARGHHLSEAASPAPLR
jgi:hypothetical protein